MSEHCKAFFKMLRSIHRYSTARPVFVQEWQIDNMDCVREFTFYGYVTKWVMDGDTLYVTVPMEVEQEIINLNEQLSERVLWARVIGKIARYPMTGEI